MYSKLTEPVFLEKFSLALKWARDVQNGPIYSFVRYYKIFLMIDSLVVFFIFCMKLRDHKCWRLMESDFLGKFLLARKRANRLKISPVYLFARFYNIFLRTDSFFFFFFFFLWYLAWDHKYSKLTELRFFEKIFSRPKSGQKWHDLDLAQNGAICVFLQYDSPFFKIGSLVFFIFCVKLRDHKQFSWENLCLPESGPKRPKMTRFVCSSVMSGLFSGLAHYFFLYFEWSSGTTSNQNWRS